jgi:sugar O-acyltransferase (sialic acid O-acetyltransferase NeuD family)
MPNKEESIFVLMGAGGHGAVVAEAIELSGGQIANFVDHFSTSQELCGYGIVSEHNSIVHENSKFIVTIGDNATRKTRVLERERIYGIVKHPAASISKRSLLGEGSVVMAGVCINTNTTIGKHCIINTSSTIDHDCIIEDFVHVAPSSALAGGVEVGEGSFIGLGAFIIQGVKIGKWCIIGAGSVVIRDVPDFSVVAGVPAKFIRINERSNEEENLVVTAPHG